MRRPTTPRWTDIPSTRGLLLVAQRVDEALFDYTIDSYKAPALNTHTRCFELQRMLHEVREGRMPEKTLKPLYEELAESIANDRVALRLLGSAADQLKQVGAWTQLATRDAEAQLEVVETRLQGRRYEEALLKQLEKAITDADAAEAIIEVVDNLVIEWQNLGFSRDYIWHKTRAHFFSRSGPNIDKATNLADWTRFFRKKPSKWTVVTRGSPDLATLTGKLPTALIEVLPKAPPPRTNKTQELEYLSADHSGVYVVVKVGGVRDARSAWDMANSILAFGTDIARFHAHRSSFEWQRESLVYNDADYPRVLGSPTSAILKHRDAEGDILTSRFASTVDALLHQDIDPDTSQRFRATLSLHTAALATKSIDTQLFSLWSALETLIPLDGSASRIDRLCELIVPLLSRQYPRKLISELHDSLTDGCAAYNEVIAQMPENSDPLVRCGCLAVLESSVPLRAKIYTAAEAHPLLCFRLQSVNRRLRSPDAIRKTIEAHEHRVNWHIRRIYRNRNMIVHRGATLPYQAALVENLHRYLDTCVETLERAFISAPRPRSMLAALRMVAHDYAAHMGALDHLKRQEVSPANVPILLFGPANPAAPPNVV